MRLRDRLFTAEAPTTPGVNPIVARQREIRAEAQEREERTGELGLVNTEFGPAQLFDPSDPRFQDEVDRLLGTIDQNERVLVTQPTGRPIEQRGVARFNVDLALKKAFERQAGLTGQPLNPPVVQDLTQGGGLIGDLLRTNKSRAFTPARRTEAIEQVKRVQRTGKDLLSDPAASRALGFEPQAQDF
jgi:hypothetical protein